MKKVIVVMSLMIMFLLSGCTGIIGMSPDGPDTVSFENQTYKTGFYGTMFPQKFVYSEETFLKDGVKFRKIKHDMFDLYHADIGQYTEGTIYCDEKQYDEAYSYYSDSKNFYRYCIIDNLRVEINDVDTEMFDSLLIFADDSDYRPFDSEHNERVETIELPMPDDKINKYLTFYKESTDSLFVSSQGHEFYIIDNNMYFVYQYYGGENEKLIAVEVPTEISEYFVEYMNKYLLNNV